VRIAILGAGLSGLACAHELERLGFAPEIFERSHYVGNRAPAPEILAQCIHFSPRQDIWRYLREELMLPVQPAHAITGAVVHCPSHVAAIQGELGYMALRGRDDRSVERQLERHISAPIQFGVDPDLSELAREYDRVVVATGDHELASRLGQWQPDTRWLVRGALVRGAFRPGELQLFFHPRYARTGYGLLSPLDQRTAVAMVAVPDSTPSAADRHWSIFRAEQDHRWERELEQFRLVRECGQVRSPVVGNLLLTGVAGGFVEPLAMSGQCPAMASGVLAARQIALGDQSLERFARRWRIYYARLQRLRRSVSAWTDADMDRLGEALLNGGNLVAHLPLHLLDPAGLGWDMLRPE
jgi:flavin-dependent dehydrogenase